MERKVIGHIGVDSGQVFIIDPCYLKDYKDDDEEMDFENPKYPFCYSGCCKITLSQEGAGEYNGGVVSQTGYGDGTYPVTAHIKDGRIMKLTIDFS